MTLPGPNIHRVLPFELKVARGMTGFDKINKFGHNEDIDTLTVPEDIWDGGGLYTFSSVATTYYISSSTSSDLQDVWVECLTEDASGDWNKETTTITLAGQAKTAIPFASGDNPIRIYRAFNDNSTDFAGDVYIYEDDTVTSGVPDTSNKIRAKIKLGDNQTEMAIYTVPSKKIGYLGNWYLQLDNNRSSNAAARIKKREFNKTFRILGRANVDNTGSSYYVRDYKYDIKLPPKTDIIVTVTAVGANDTEVSSDFDILLEDTE